jgi:putative nucleotide binding protein
MIKEEYALVLDFLPYGYTLEGKTMPIAQVIGENNLILLEVFPSKGISLQIDDRIYIGDGKRDKVHFIRGRLLREKLTETAKKILVEFIKSVIERREKDFVSFFNTAEPINTRVHQLELLPGFGKKHKEEILKARENEEFKNFDDIKKRIPSLPDPKKAVEKRIFEELTEIQRHNLFVK